MTDSNTRPTSEIFVIETPHWTPPFAPLDMPEQVLEPRDGGPRFDIQRLIRLLLPGKPV